MDNYQVRRQKHMFEQAQAVLGRRQKAFEEIQAGDNPLTREEFEDFKKKHVKWSQLTWMEPTP